MKRISSVVAGLMLMQGSLLLAEGMDSPRTISVSGTVDTKTAPDQIVWSINLTDTDTDMRAAKARSDEKVRSVVSLRKKLRVGEGDLETGRVSIRREYERDQHGRRAAFKHFVVSHSVTIRQRDLKRFDEFLDALVSCAEMEVSFGFESSRIHEVRAETRLKALKVAQEKAAAMAEVVGAKLGRVLVINEHPQDGSRHVGIGNNASVSSGPPGVDAASDKFVPGAINVRVTVYATFELE
jgi:uncharacterized protein YggE